MQASDFPFSLFVGRCPVNESNDFGVLNGLRGLKGLLVLAKTVKITKIAGILRWERLEIKDY